MVTPGRGPLEFDVNANIDEARRNLTEIEELADRATQDQNVNIDADTGQAERALERTEEAAGEAEDALSRVNGQIQDIPLIGDAFRALQTPVGILGAAVGAVLVTFNDLVNRSRDALVLAGVGGFSLEEADVVTRAARQLGEEPDRFSTTLLQFARRQAELLGPGVTDEEGAVFESLGITRRDAEILTRLEFFQLILDRIATRLDAQDQGLAIEVLGGEEELAYLVRPDLALGRPTLQEAIRTGLEAPREPDIIREEIRLAQQGADVQRTFTERLGDAGARSLRLLSGQGLSERELGGLLGSDPTLSTLDRILSLGGPSVLTDIFGADVPIPTPPSSDALPGSQGGVLGETPLRRRLSLGVADDRDESAGQTVVIQTFIGDEQLDTVVSESQLRNTQRGRNDGAPNWGR